MTHAKVSSPAPEPTWGGPQIASTHEPRPVFEAVAVAKSPDRREYPAAFANRLMIDVVHDGCWIPEEFMTGRDGRRITLADIEEDYVRERDWGASLVAERLAQNLGLPAYHRVNVARVLMDFGRFPGSTPRLADHLHRYAINYPFSKLLGYRQKKRLLEAYYDEVSRGFEPELAGKLVKIAIHTYDTYNDSGTERPPVSLMTRSIGYQTESEMPWGLFDPLYPDILGEFTADRILRDRISLTLEKSQIAVEHNYPYLLPEGSLEVRYQVWAYFRHLRREFERAHPDSQGDPNFGLVWRMLCDTNLRSSESEALRSYLHMFRRAPPNQLAQFEAAEIAYEGLAAFWRQNKQRILDDYRFSPERPSALAIEIRKDIVAELDDEGRPIRARWDRIHRIADAIADAVAVYLREDREVHAGPFDDALERKEPWYVRPHGAS